ncbi:MAG: GAF domain-containing sensor histidine kinase, partial [Bacteroidales bacterium]|nr:GAF domain-containing sensor histidine kinase [Bacteroidales bacterium]
NTNNVPHEAIEAKLFTKNGIAHYFLWKNNLLFDENGVVNGILSSGLNITELKQAQNLLTDKELKTSRLNQLSQLALQMQDEKNSWIKLSEKLQELIQCDVVYITTWDENTKKAIPLAAPAEIYDFYINYTYKPGQKSLTESVLEKGEALVIQNTEDTEHISQDISNDFKTKSGLGLPMIVGEKKLGAILVGFNSYHKFSATEVEWGILAANHIALALHKSLLINELKKINEDKDRFFTMLSHDLKSPFSGIEHLISFMAENQEALSDAELSEMLNTLGESTKNLNVLIDNMLSWSRLNRGLMKLNPEHFALSELVEDVCNLLENQAREKKIILNKDIDPSINIEADREILKAVLRNLISNAIKFSYSGAHVNIKSKLNEDKIALIVADEGIGITNEHLEKLRKNGSIPSQPGTANETGTGLGLLIIQEFVKLHKGQLLIQSEPQAGSTFTVELPRHTKTYS